MIIAKNALITVMPPKDGRSRSSTVLSPKSSTRVDSSTVLLQSKDASLMAEKTMKVL